MSHNFLRLIFNKPEIFDFDIDEIQQDKNLIDDRQWFDELLQNIELNQKNDAILKFKIIDIRKKGFIVQSCGLYAYISFYYMPWHYDNYEYWHTIFPSLKNKIFDCKVHKIIKDPLLILLNADLPQFKLVLQRQNFSYKGIILQKVNQEIFIDFGYHYHWKYGSICGYINESQLEDKTISEYSVGDVIYAKFFGMDENGFMKFSQKKFLLDWILNKPQSFVGKITWLEVIKEKNSRTKKYFVLGKYSANLDISRDYYTSSEKNKLQEALSKIENHAILNCEVLSYNLKNMTLKVNWIPSTDLGIVHDKGIIEKLNEALNQNRLNNETITKI